jgi:type III restriction enzyme
VAEITEKISSSEYAIDDRLSRLRWMPAVHKGFTELKPSAFTVAATDIIHDFRQTVQDRTRIAQILFGGFQRCLYAIQKFQSDSERRLAIILDRGALKWFKPARG